MQTAITPSKTTTDITVTVTAAGRDITEPSSRAITSKRNGAITSTSVTKRNVNDSTDIQNGVNEDISTRDLDKTITAARLTDKTATSKTTITTTSAITPFGLNYTVHIVTDNSDHRTRKEQFTPEIPSYDVSPILGEHGSKDDDSRPDISLAAHGLDVTSLESETLIGNDVTEVYIAGKNEDSKSVISNKTLHQDLTTSQSTVSSQPTVTSIIRSSFAETSTRTSLAESTAERIPSVTAAQTSKTTKQDSFKSGTSFHVNKPVALSLSSPPVGKDHKDRRATSTMSTTIRVKSSEHTDPPYGIVSGPDDSTTQGPVEGGSQTAAIVVPIFISLLALALTGVVVFLVYRRKQRHRKANIMKYKRHSQNGEVVIPLTSVSNDTYRSTRVSAHEEAMVYSQVDKTIRPPRPTYRYKSEEVVPLKLTITDDETTPNVTPNNNNMGDLDTVIVDNENYSASPTKSDSAPKVPMRKSSSESGSLKRTPGTNKRDISWPIPKGDISPNGSVTPVSVRSSQYAPPVPPSPRHGPPSARPIPPSPRTVPPIPISERPTPPTPPTPQPGHPRRANNDHEYDPVYVPRSDADALIRRLDDAGYVTSRSMRMNAVNRQQPYEDVEVYTEVASGSIPSTGHSVSSASASPSRSLRSTSLGPSSPALNRTRTDCESSEGPTGDQSFDTVETETSNKVAFSVEDISKICDDSFGATSVDRDVEYTDIPGDYEYPEGTFSINQFSESEEEKEEPAYEAVGF